MDLAALLRPKIEPKPHQWQTRDFLLGNMWNFNLSEMGTGKTLGEVLALRELYRHDAVRRILVVAPLSVLGCVWDEHLQDFAPDVPRLLLNDSGKRGKLMGTAGDGVLMINPDGVVSLCNELHAWNPQLVIIDELAGYYRNMVGTTKKANGPGREHNQRWAAMAGLLQRGRRQTPNWPMTGTPMPKGLMDAYAQMMLVAPWRLPRLRNGRVITYKAMREMLHTQPYPNVWRPRPGALEQVYDMMQPAIRFTRRQVMAELDDAIRMRRQIPLSPEQKRMLAELQAAAKTTYGDTTIKGAVASSLATKVTQIACGAVYGCSDKIAYPPATARLDEVCKIQDEAGSPIILAVPFIHVAHMLQKIGTERFKKRVACIMGETPPNERTRIVHEFQAGGLDWLVCHPKTAAHGLTLTRSHTIVWYAPIDDQELSAQLDARISRFGQNEKPVIIELYSTPAELKVYQRNQSKEALQGKFLDFFE